jgi:hypothetical protein
MRLLIAERARAREVKKEVLALAVGDIGSSDEDQVQ